MKTPKLNPRKKRKSTELCYLLECNGIDCDDCIIESKVESYKILITYTEDGKDKTVCIK